MKKRTPWASPLHLVDMYLILLMFLLLIYLGIRLFLQGAVSQGTNPVDVVVRTSAIGIFGYFLSGNFSGQADSSTSVRSNSGGTRPVEIPSPDSPENPVKNQIGFVSPEDGSMQPGTVNSDNQPEQPRIVCSKMQVIVVGSIGLAALILLMIAREISTTSPDAVASLSQFRDYVSASVGFLISCGRRAEK